VAQAVQEAPSAAAAVAVYAENLPDEQVEQSLIPAAENFPLTQFSHALEPDNEACLPGEQLEHVEDSVTLIVPAAQAVQVLEPEVAEKNPAMQAVHVEAAAAD
jgi:hypothetical protein